MEMRLIMKEWRALVLLEYEWRTFRYYRKLLNRLVKKGMSLSSPILCYLNKRMDKHGVKLFGLKEGYESRTGKVLVFYKCDDYL